MQIEYYTDELTAIPFRVMLRMISLQAPAFIAYPIAAIFAMRGKIGWRFAANYAYAPATHAELLSNDQIPAAVASRWAPRMEQLQDLGYSVLCYRKPKVIGAKQHYVALLRREDGLVLAALEWHRLTSGTMSVEEVSLELDSYGDEDPEVMTAMTKPANLPLEELFKFDFMDIVMISDAFPIRQLADRHEERISHRRMFRLSPEAAVEEHVKRSLRRFQAVRQSGLVRPLSTREIESVKAKSLPPL